MSYFFLFLKTKKEVCAVGFFFLWEVAKNIRNSCGNSQHGFLIKAAVECSFVFSLVKFRWEILSAGEEAGPHLGIADWFRNFTRACHGNCSTFEIGLQSCVQSDSILNYD